jgi:peptidoglycan/xylan/chitin deacetylase (PgdA/CDA1 family)
LVAVSGARTRTLGGLLTAAAILGVAACGGSSPPTTASRQARMTTAHRAASAKPAAGTPVSRRTVPRLVAAAPAPPRSVQVPVLTYHRVHTMPAVGQPDLIVDPATFASELQALSSGGYHTITQAQLFDAMYKGAALPAKPVIISVDDGYVDDVRTVLPDLQRFHMVATFFVITSRTTEPGFVTEAQIRELDRAGMDVGDHTAHHVDLNLLSASQLRAETAGSRQRLQAILGHPVYFFAYPFGAYNDTVVRAIRAAGFTLAYTTAGGTTESTSAPLTLPRIHVGRPETASGLVSLLGGA